ncbi:VOC family protein [Chthonobacter albigriseus]|uniref:VOC family protein n=1 Tax=Chthonobacter albigriseus TaxID=1683161 RepID=UPI0015EEFFAB|nr:glyoxalase/bleomycin resistance/extradiol dioxygenase family protein [Chthonobacter albigriseus]
MSALQSPNPAPTSMVIEGVTPYLRLPDAAAASAFYQQAFGAREVARIPADDGKRLLHCHLLVNDGVLFLNDAFPEYGYPLEPYQGFTLHLQVPEPRVWWARALDAGCTVEMEMRKEFWGDLFGRVRDPYGVLWSIGGPVPAETA